MSGSNRSSDCVQVFFFFKQKTAYEMELRLEFRRVLFRSTSSTVSSESAPRSFTKEDVLEIFSLATPSCLETISTTLVSISAADAIAPPAMGIIRSEERRVGKECRYRWSQDRQ